MAVDPFFPHPIYAVEDSDTPSVPRVLIAPHRYIQADGVLDHLGRYLSIVPSTRPAVLISEGGQRRYAARLIVGMKLAGVHPVAETFGGECSTEEIERVVGALRKADAPVDSVVAVGGGKCLDTAKGVAYRMALPVVICPTIASTDAPCSAVSVIYTEDGSFKGVEWFPVSPALVVVDTGIIAQAPARYLVAGMGDAVSTWYEARTCFANPKARSVVGARVTIAAQAIAELSARTVFDHGVEALLAVEQGEVTEALERVVEANTLLSGVGFESGGLAAAHAVATVALTAIPKVHHHFLHGEMVAIGVLTQLALEGDVNEARRVGSFFSSIGLPVHLGQIGLDVQRDAEALEAAMASAMQFPIIHNEPFEVTAESLLAAALQAHKLGIEVSGACGDVAYKELHTAPV
ncbi:MAG: glycerol dehydrogenase [Gemmatimonadales bacterium]|nr:glycerol dehydrogenase [Gemmatimonadales bacterium]